MPGWMHMGMRHVARFAASLSMEMTMRKQSSVIVQDMALRRWIYNMFDHLLHFNWKASTKLLDRLGEFKLLRVLDLEDCKAMEDKHMKHLCHMYLLRYLGLRGTRISAMPSKIGNLEYLETLDVEMTGIKDLPPTATKLSKLQRLRVNRWVLTWGLENIKALREVYHVHLIKGDI
jgi:disease resistance protein RPM1